MTKNFPGEQWKLMKFDFEPSNQFRMEVSNFGRLRSFNKISNGNILQGSLINGYRILRMKLLKPRERKVQKELDRLRKEIAALTSELRETNAKRKAAGIVSHISELKKTLTVKMKEDEKTRTVYYQSLVHRITATYFLKKPTAKQTIVAHLDFNKLNNRANNLKWMTPEENYAHQRNSPYVIAEKSDRRTRRTPGHTTKLSVTKVMLLKKLLNQNKPVRKLAKQFKVTDTQIIRIRKGENWGDIEAAK